jgi:large subunit ribosomal protein L22
MHKMRYSRFADPETTARGIGRELVISPKKTYELCNALRGRMLEEAYKILDGIEAEKRAIKYQRYDTMVAHKKGIGPGRFPVNAAKDVRKLLEHVEANAREKQLQGDLKILHIACHRGQINKSYRPRARGSSSPFNQKTVNVEVILEEIEKEE